MQEEKSKCCESDVSVIGDTTKYYKCKLCGKACDLSTEAKEYKDFEVRKVTDITGHYWAFIDCEGYEFGSCRRKIDSNSEDGYSYEEAKERAEKLFKHINT